MAAVIVMDDGGGPQTGSIETSLTTPVTLVNFDDTGVLAHQWTLQDRPIGSAASLSTLTGPATVLVPDIEGSYLVLLQTYVDLGATILDDADLQGVGVRFPAPFAWRIPAAGVPQYGQIFQGSSMSLLQFSQPFLSLV